MSSVRLAAVNYLNARPLWDAFTDPAFAPEVTLSTALPSEVARQIAEEEVDVGLVPVAALASLGDARIVRGVGITSPGPVESVVLVSEVPFDRVEKLTLDASSRTSLVLARLVMRHRFERDFPVEVMRSEDAVASVRGARASLVIGDPALEVRDRFPYVLDLAEAWREWTGLPFVFAAWGGRAGGLDAAGEARLLEAKRVGRERSDAIADAHAAARGLDGTKLRNYLRQSIRHELADAERRGLERFFSEAHKARLLPRAEVRFFDDDRVASASPMPAINAKGASSSLPAPLMDAGRVHPAPSLDGLLSRAAEGDRLSAAEGERLLAEASLFDLGFAADAVRKRKHPHGTVTYIVDRNVNYTNVCTTSCRFCAFYRPVGHAEGYVLSREVLGKKLQEVVDAGGVQILLQGGLNPELRIEWYEDLFRWMKREYGLGLHALSPEEIIHIGELEGLSVGRVLERLHAAGLDSVPGGGAEILVDRVRRKIAKAKCTSEQWLGVMRTAHHMGLRSSSTMMYGTTDTPRDRILHLAKLRDLQDETGGFTAFFCWDFQHEEGVRITAGDGGTPTYLRTQAVARLMLDNIDHVGASWVTQGPDIGQLALRFGADDFGSVMFEENVVSSAGTTFGINAEEIERRIRSAGFRAVRRNVRYEWLNEPS